MNKSSKSLIEDHGLKNPNYDEKKPSTPHNAPLWIKPPVSNKELMNRSNIQEQPKVESLASIKDLSLIKTSYNTMSRSSSLKVLNKDENINDGLEGQPNKFNDVSKNRNDIYLPNGNNVIHVTVNNFVNSPTITNTINRFNRPSKLENTIKDKDAMVVANDSFNYRDNKNQGNVKPSLKNYEEENNKKENSYDRYFNYSKSVFKPDQTKEKTNESSSILNDYKENKKRVIYLIKI